MEDRNRRDQRNRHSQSQRDRYNDDLGSRQAEQFDDSSAYELDRDWALDSRKQNQAGEDRYAQRTWGASSQWRDPRVNPPSEDDARGWSGRFGGRNSGFAGDYYDNGLSDYDSDSTRGRNGMSRQRFDRGATQERGFFERAGDEVASWFGDTDAARRRREDHRGKGPANYKRTDERILEDVCDCLTEDWRIDARNVQVTVASGEVTLDGTVDSRAAKRRAEDLVDDVSGVSHVQNNLRVQAVSGADYTQVDS